MNHKLRVLIRLDVDPGQVTLEVSGCLTQANYSVLLHVMRRGQRLTPQQAITVDLQNASHLDPEVMMYLRHLAGRETPASPNAGTQGTTPETLQLTEPVELPICLHHAGLAAEVRTGLDDEIDALLDGEANPAPDSGPDTELDTGSQAAPGEQRTINGLELSEYLEGTLDPSATVRALSNPALRNLADALYRHLDTRSPAFGAHTWYELATEELRQRQPSKLDGPAQEEVAAG